MDLIDLGLMGYTEALEMQKKILDERIHDLRPNTLLIAEHPAVYTIGKAMSQTMDYPTAVIVENEGSIPVIPVDRGGKMTFHGPGQWVAYPIFGLVQRDIRKFLRDLEKVLVKAIQPLGLEGRPCPETLELEAGQLETGLWVKDKKLGSIGVHVRHWVSYHGVALNVNPDLKFFQAIEPCGFSGDILSSVVEELKRKKSHLKTGPELMAQVKTAMIEGFTALSDHYDHFEKSLGNKKEASSSPDTSA